MERQELLEHYIELMGADAEEKGFYEELAFKTEQQIINAIIELAYYYKYN